MGNLENKFIAAVGRASDQRGKPALLGKGDGTLYWVDDSGMTHRTRVWARIGEQASNQLVVVDCLKASPQIDMPVRVDYKNGRLTVIEEDGNRAIEFSGGRPGAGVGAHAWLHSRLGPDPVYIEGLQFLPLLVTPTNPPDLTVTVQGGAYTDSAGDLAIHETAVSGSTSAFVPATDYHFVIICLDRTDGSIVIVDGDDITAEDVLFSDVVVTAADIEAITISADYKTLGVVVLYPGQTQIKAKDIVMDLRTDGGAGGGGTPGGSNTQLQYNNGGSFGGIADFIYNDSNGRLLLGATSPATTAKLEIHPTAAQDARNALVSTQAVSAANTVGIAHYLNNATPALVNYGEFSIGSTTNTAGSEYGVAKIDVLHNGIMRSVLYLDATGGLSFNEDQQDINQIFRSVNAPQLLVLDAGANELRIGSTTPLEGGVAVFGSSGVVINDEELDRDFRIAGNGVTNGYFYDGGLNRHGFGTNAPLEELHVIGSNTTGIRLSNAASGSSSYFSIIDSSAGRAALEKHAASGTCLIDIDPYADDGTSASSFRFFRLTNTTGPVGLEVYKGNGSSTRNARIAGNGDTHLAANNGNISLFNTGSFGGGVKVLGIANCTTVPSSNPTGGGILYVEAGALKYRGSSGGVTILGGA